MVHRIHHQILELELPREAGAIALQRRASRIFQEQVLPRLDAAFSRIAPTDRVVRIQELTVDLGNIGEAGWEEAFVEACVAQISQQVAECAFEVRPNQADNVENISREASSLEVLRFFLENGFMPWFASGMTVATLENDIQSADFTRISPAEKQRWRLFFQRNPAALKRLVWQFRAPFSTAFFASVLDIPETALAEVFRRATAAFHAVMTPQMRIRVLGNLLSADLQNVRQPADWSDVLAAVFSREMSDFKNPEKSKTHDEPEAIKRPATHMKPDVLEGIAVENAGLVILAAYLPTFFRKNELDLTAPENEALVFQAIHALHFMATGKTNPEEPSLILPKILCGLSLETPVPQDVELSSEIQSEVTNLLEAVIRNWSVLKSASPDGLRSGFLMRNGILTWQEDRQSWLLQVERLGQDLLLDHLPWTFGTVKLPWMEYFINTEW